jgi:hypothetical protein
MMTSAMMNGSSAMIVLTGTSLETGITISSSGHLGNTKSKIISLIVLTGTSLETGITISSSGHLGNTKSKIIIIIIGGTHSSTVQGTNTGTTNGHSTGATNNFLSHHSSSGNSPGHFLSTFCFIYRIHFDPTWMFKILVSKQ